jgi:LysR family transcriptional regulator, regulator for metE and metH
MLDHQTIQTHCFHRNDEQDSWQEIPSQIDKKFRGGAFVNLEIRHLKLVSAVAEEGSMTKASSRLHLTQSALSHQLRDIEEKLGVTLFQRTTKRMLLTPPGERLLESARRVLEELENAEKLLQQDPQHTEGVLRITTQCYTCYHWLPAQIQAFQKKYPRIEVRIVAEATRRAVEALLEGELDLAIVSDPIRNRKVELEPLFEDEFFLVVAPDHPLASRAYATAEDLADEHVILYTDDKKDSTLYQEVLVPAGVSPRRMSSVHLTEAIVEMVKAGLGVSTVAGWAIAPYVKTKQVKIVRLTRNGIHRNWQAATLRNAKRPTYIDNFVKLATRMAPVGITPQKRAS